MFLTLDEVLKKHDQKLLKLNFFFGADQYLFRKHCTCKVKLFTNIWIFSVFADEHYKMIVLITIQILRLVCV